MLTGNTRFQHMRKKCIQKKLPNCVRRIAQRHLKTRVKIMLTNSPHARSMAAALILLLLIAGCSKKERRDDATPMEKDTGYIIGVDIGARLKKQPLPIDLQSVLDGISDYYGDKKLRIPLDSIYELQEKLEKIGHNIESEMAKNREQAMVFLDSNGKNPNVQSLLGIQYQVLQPGTSPETPSDSDVVLCNISCSLLNGTSIKNTWKTNSPERFKVAKTLPGLSVAIKTMSRGTRLRVWVPPELGFGREGIPGSIPAYSLLVYDLELLAIEGK